MDGVLEFTNVSRPWMVLEQAHGIFGEGEFGKTQACGDFLDEVFGEETDIFGALSKRRELDTNDIEAVEEVLSEAAVGHLLFEIFVRCGDDTDIGLDHLVTADAGEFPVLEHAQNFGLELDGHVADLVEEEGAAVALFEAACALRYGTGESAFFVTEQFAFEELLGDGGTVDGDVGPVVPLGVLVNRAGDEFLP